MGHVAAMGKAQGRLAQNPDPSFGDPPCMTLLEHLKRGFSRQATTQSVVHLLADQAEYEGATGKALHHENRTQRPWHHNRIKIGEVRHPAPPFDL